MPPIPPLHFSFNGAPASSENAFHFAAPTEAPNVTAAFARFSIGKPSRARSSKRADRRRKPGRSARKVPPEVPAPDAPAQEAAWFSASPPRAPSAAAARSAVEPPRSPLAPLNAPRSVARTPSPSRSSRDVGSAAVAPAAAPTAEPRAAPEAERCALLSPFDRSALRVVALFAARCGDAAGVASRRVAAFVPREWCRPDGRTLAGRLALALARARDLERANVALRETNERLEVVVTRQQIALDRLSVLAEREKRRVMEEKIDRRRKSEAAANVARQQEAVKEHRAREAGEAAAENLRSAAKERAAQRIAQWRDAADPSVSCQPLRDLLLSLHTLLPEIARSELYDALRSASADADDGTYIKAVKRAKRQTLALLHPDKHRGSAIALVAEMAYSAISSVDLPEPGDARRAPRRAPRRSSPKQQQQQQQRHGGGAQRGAKRWAGGQRRSGGGGARSAGRSGGEAHSKVCAVCGAYTERSGFSKTQWGKKHGGKCRLCVDRHQYDAEDFGNWY